MHSLHIKVTRSANFLKLTIYYTERTVFVEISKNLTKYRFENNFVKLSKQLCRVLISN